MLLRAPDEILRAFGRIVAAEASPAGPSTFTVGVEAIDRSAGQWRFTLPDTTVEFGPMGEVAVAHSLLTQFTRLTVLSHPHSWFLHAGVVLGPEGAVAAMAPSGTGKSTFVARLLQAGYRYLSDELAWIQPETWDVLDYPKPVALDEISLELLRPSGTAPQPMLVSDGSAEHLLTAQQFGSDRDPSGSGRLRLLVGVTRGDGNPDTVRFLPDADKVAAVLDNQLNLMQQPDPLRAACDLVSNVACAQIATDDLDAAVIGLAEAGRTARTAELESLVHVPASDPGSAPISADGRFSMRFSPFTMPRPTEPLSVADFADGSAVVVGTTTGRYAVTNAGGARLAAALGCEQSIIDLAPACDVSVRDAEAYFSQLGELRLVGAGTP